MGRKTKQAPLRTRSGVVLDDKKIQELVRVFEDEETEWGEPLPKSQWPGRGRGRPSLTAGRDSCRLLRAIRQGGHTQRRRSEGSNRRHCGA